MKLQQGNNTALVSIRPCLGQTSPAQPELCVVVALLPCLAAFASNKGIAKAANQLAFLTSFSPWINHHDDPPPTPAVSQTKLSEWLCPYVIPMPLHMRLEAIPDCALDFTEARTKWYGSLMPSVGPRSQSKKLGHKTRC